MNNMSELVTDSDENTSSTAGSSNTFCLNSCPRTPEQQRLSKLMVKYAKKQERRKVLKMSFKKLRPVVKRRSKLSHIVVIKNTVKQLKKEIREEKLKKRAKLENPDADSDNENNETCDVCLEFSQQRSPEGQMNKTNEKESARAHTAVFEKLQNDILKMLKDAGKLQPSVE